MCYTHQAIEALKFRGLVAPVFTPFKSGSGFDLNLDIIPDYLRHLKSHNINAILVNGTSGEGVSMTVEEREAVLEAWMTASKGNNVMVMAQVGGAPLTSVLRMARHAEKQGANALLCLPDLFFKPRTEKELSEYLAEVARAAPSTPLFYYHIPSFSDVNLDMEKLLDECCGKIPTFGGIKFTHTDLEQGSRCVHFNGGIYTVFLGADQVTAGAAIMGFDSVISTTLNMYPELSHGIFESVRSGNVQQALETQLQLNENIRRITSTGSWVSSMKAAMEKKTGLKMGPPRLPLSPVSVDEFQNIL